MATNCTRLIEVDKLFFADNVRTPECLQLPEMCESIRRHGFKANHPLIVHEKQVDGNTRYHVLVGNRRGLALIFLRDNEPEVYRQALQDGKVAAIVHKGLTQEEEIEHRIDHSFDEDRVPLDDFSIFLAIQQLLLAGNNTQDRIATKLGLLKLRGKDKGQPNRSYVQVRVNLARLPGFVQDEFRKLMVDGKDTTPVRLSMIAGLYTAHNKEYTDHPQGNGPLLQAAWDEAMTPKEDKADNNDEQTSKELSPAEAVKRSQGAQSNALKQVLLIVTQQSDVNLASVDASIVEGEAAVALLASIAGYLGDGEYNDLVSSAASYAKDQQPSEAIIDDSIPEEVPA